MITYLWIQRCHLCERSHALSTLIFGHAFAHFSDISRNIVPFDRAVIPKPLRDFPVLGVRRNGDVAHEDFVRSRFGNGEILESVGGGRGEHAELFLWESCGRH